MLVIRLARVGRNKYPTYRIVAAESSRATTGKFVELLGHYNPHTKEVSLKTDEIKGYIANGAQPSNSMIRLLQKEKVELPVWAKLETKNKKPKSEPAAAPEAAAAPAAESTEATPEAAEEPAEDEVRVAAVAADAAGDTAEASVSDNTAETAESEAGAVKAAKDGDTAAAEAAISDAE